MQERIDRQRREREQRLLAEQADQAQRELQLNLVREQIENEINEKQLILENDPRYSRLKEAVEDKELEEALRMVWEMWNPGVSDSFREDSDLLNKIDYRKSERIMDLPFTLKRILPVIDEKNKDRSVDEVLSVGAGIEFLIEYDVELAKKLSYGALRDENMRIFFGTSQIFKINITIHKGRIFYRAVQNHDYSLESYSSEQLFEEIAKAIVNNNEWIFDYLREPANQEYWD